MFSVDNQMFKCLSGDFTRRRGKWFCWGEWCKASQASEYKVTMSRTAGLALCDKKREKKNIKYKYPSQKEIDDWTDGSDLNMRLFDSWKLWNR